MKPEQERVKTVLIDTVALLCKNGLPFERELRIQAVIGVSVDEADVFIVHINESFGPQGSGGSTAAASAETSTALVPFRPQDHQVKREAPGPRTPASGVKRMRAETDVGMSVSPMSDHAKHFVKQQLRFPSPGKSPVASSGAGMPASSGMEQPAAMMCPPMLSRGRARGGQRGGLGRGFASGRSHRGLGMTRGGARGGGRVGGRSRGPRPRAAYSPAQQSPYNNCSSSAPGPSYDVKFTDRLKQAPATAAAADSSVGFGYNPYHAAPAAPSPYAASSTATHMDNSHSSGGGLPPFSAHDQDQFSDTVPPGFGFDGMFSSDALGVQSSASLAGINPTLEFGFPSNFSSASDGFATHVQNASAAAGVKAESLDDDIIFVEDDVVPGPGNIDDPATMSGGGNSGLFEGSTDDANGVAGAAVQQITRRVTITTNIQGQNVKYEQVQHAVATLPGPVAAANPPLDSTAPSTSTFAGDLADPSASLLHDTYQQTPVYDYAGFTSPTVADTKPGWDVLSGAAGSASYPVNTASTPSYRASAATSVPRQPPQHHPAAMPRPRPPSNKRLMTPRSDVSSTRMPAMRMSQSAGSLDAVHPNTPQRAGATAGAGAAASRKHSIGGLPLSDVGVGGGRVEDGTAWSMVARFVCSVPGCGASFTRKQNLLRHQTQKHGRPKSAPRTASGADDIDDDDSNDQFPAGFY